MTRKRGGGDIVTKMNKRYKEKESSIMEDLKINVNFSYHNKASMGMGKEKQLSTAGRSVNYQCGSS